MLEIKKLFKKYNNKIALQDFSIDTEPGDCIGIVGKNGAGKTTLFNILSDIQLPESGSIFYNGENIINNFPIELKKKLGVFLNSNLLIDELNAIEYLEFISTFYDLKTPQEDIYELLNYFFNDLSDLTKPIKNYSFGMKQKVLLISSILHKPLILILDEPFNGLDIFSSRKLLDILKKILPFTIIFIASHNLSYINEIATSIVVLDDGVTLFKGSIDSFLERGKGQITDSLFELLKPMENELDNINWANTYEQQVG